MKLKDPWSLKFFERGYTIYDDKDQVVGRYLDLKMAAEHHKQALQELYELKKSIKESLEKKDLTLLENTLKQCYLGCH